MSKGPGRIERAIRAMFDAHPDEAFMTDDLCVAIYPALAPIRIRINATTEQTVPAYHKIQRKHRVAVVRAAEKVLTGDPDWRRRPSWDRGKMLIFFNEASVPSVAMANTLIKATGIRREWVVERTQQDLDGKWDKGKTRENIERVVRQHIARRDGTDPVEAEPIIAEAGRAKPAQVLPDRQQVPSDNTKALAAKVRVLMVQNDPDVVRDGLAEIAAALDAMAGAGELTLAS